MLRPAGRYVDIEGVCPDRSAHMRLPLACRAATSNESFSYQPKGTKICRSFTNIPLEGHVEGGGGGYVLCNASSRRGFNTARSVWS